MLATLLLLLAPADAAPDWNRLRDATGWVQVDVARTDVGPVAIDAHEIDGIRCLRASTEVYLPRERLVEVALDVESTPRWSTAGVTEAEVLASTENGVDYWQYLDLPGWTLAADRFWFQRARHIADGPSTDVVYWTELPAGGPHAAAWKRVHDAHPEAIEPLVNVGGWVFTGDSPVRATYHLCTEAGGKLPTVVEDVAARQALPNSVADFLREVRRREGDFGS